MALSIALLAMGWGAAASATPASPLGRFERLRGQDLRVASVAYRLSIANAAQCGLDVAPQSGFVLHSIEQYGPADREAAARSFGLGNQIGVMAVIAGSPAERAGLIAGDRLVSVNGRILQSGIAADGPSRASVDRAQAILAEEMRRGAVMLRVSGAGGERDLRFSAERGCPAAIELIPGDAVNAWADGSRIMISEGLLRRCDSDADLALVIAHEMAHNLLHHRQRLAAEGISANRLLARGEAGSIAMRDTEEEADRRAVGLAVTASYDLSGAPAFLDGLLRRGEVAATHPDPDRRLALLRAAIAEAQGAGGAAPRRANTASSGLVSGRI